jgi:hypothetical protein
MEYSQKKYLHKLQMIKTVLNSLKQFNYIHNHFWAKDKEKIVVKQLSIF